MEKACGVDVHRDTLVATILSDQTKETRHFGNDPDDIDQTSSHGINQHLLGSALSGFGRGRL